MRRNPSLFFAVVPLILAFVSPALPSKGQAAKAAASQGRDSGISLLAEKGAVQVKTPLGTALSITKARLRFADGGYVSNSLEPAGTDRGSDTAGAYERFRFTLKRIPGMYYGPGTDFQAVLELRQYEHPQVVIAFLEYQGPALAATEGIQLVTSLGEFARGMATKRLKLYWTAPQIVSDYRVLGPSNQLLLWRRLRDDNYHLLVPLAGNGMIGEIGVSEIDFRFEFRVSSTSRAENYTPRRVPLFAYSTSADPYTLPRETYTTAFTATDQFGRLRWQKGYPESLNSLGWCSWNAYGNQVTEQKILNSAKSMRDRQIPIGFVLVDDGWLSTRDGKLTSFGADSAKFPRDLGGLAQTLKQEFNIPHVGVWHTLQGYWSGVDPTSDIARSHNLFNGLGGQSFPDPRKTAGESFYTDWYRNLKNAGYDFVKVDGQGNTLKFTDGLLPLFDAGIGEHRNLEAGAKRFFAGSKSGQQSAGLGVINCMEMSLENAYNWRDSNVARNSDDYLPDNPQNVKEHIYQNAYNSYWTSNFAYPDWDMFQSHDAHAEYHAIARAVSGGPIYFTDEAGREQAEILRRLAFSDGRLLMTDEPAQVTRDLLLTDPAMEPVPLKIFGTVTRDGYSAFSVAAFNVNKTAPAVAGALRVSDLQARLLGTQTFAVYERKTGRATSLGGADSSLPFALDEFGYDLFTVVSIDRGIAVFGLLDKYLSPAGVVSVKNDGRNTTIHIREAGDLGAWVERAPRGVEVDGRALPSAAFSYHDQVLKIPASSFGVEKGEHMVRIFLANGRRA